MTRTPRRRKKVAGFKPCIHKAKTSCSAKGRYAQRIASDVRFSGESDRGKRETANWRRQTIYTNLSKVCILEKVGNCVTQTIFLKQPIQIDPSPTKKMDVVTTNKSGGRKRHYFNGCPKKSFPCSKAISFQENLVHPVTKLRVISTMRGAEMVRNDKENTLVFRLLPRKEIIKNKMWDATENYEVITEYLEECNAISKKKTLVRNSKAKLRSAVFEDNDIPVYECPGAKVMRSSVGISDTKPDGLSAKVWNNLLWMMARIEQMATEYIEHERICGLNEARNIVQWKEVQYCPIDDENKEGHQQHLSTSNCATKDNKKLRKSPEIWQQVAISRNVALNCHTDDDFFLSCLTVAVDEKAYRIKNCEPVQYFAFPEDGVAIALRPGDILIFNSRIPHCITSRANVGGDDVLVCSLYLKTALVGGNNRNCDPLVVETEGGTVVIGPDYF
jgi:hypothetical protein